MSKKRNSVIVTFIKAAKVLLVLYATYWNLAVVWAQNITITKFNKLISLKETIAENVSKPNAKIIDEFNKLFSDFLKEQLNKAEEFAEAQDWTQARDCIEKILQIDPFNSTAILYYRWLFKTQLSKLVTDCRTAISIASNGEIEKAERIIEPFLDYPNLIENYKKVLNQINQNMHVIEYGTPGFLDFGRYEECENLKQQEKWTELAFCSKRILEKKPKSKKALKYLEEATTEIMKELDLLALSGKWESAIEKAIILRDIGGETAQQNILNKKFREITQKSAQESYDRALNMISTQNKIDAIFEIEMGLLFDPCNENLADLLNSIKKEEKESEEWFQKAQQAFDNKNITEAVQYCQVAITQTPYNLKAYELLSRLAKIKTQIKNFCDEAENKIQEGDYSAAINLMESALLLENDLSIKEKLDNIRKKMEVIDKKIKNVRELCSRKNFYEAFKLIKEILYESPKNEEARKSAEEILKSITLELNEQKLYGLELGFILLFEDVTGEKYQSLRALVEEELKNKAQHNLAVWRLNEYDASKTENIGSRISFELIRILVNRANSEMPGILEIKDNTAIREDIETLRKILIDQNISFEEKERARTQMKGLNSILHGEVLAYKAEERMEDRFTEETSIRYTYYDEERNENYYELKNRIEQLRILRENTRTRKEKENIEEQIRQLEEELRNTPRTKLKEQVGFARYRVTKRYRNGLISIGLKITPLSKDNMILLAPITSKDIKIEEVDTSIEISAIEPPKEKANINVPQNVKFRYETIMLMQNAMLEKIKKELDEKVWPWIKKQYISQFYESARKTEEEIEKQTNVETKQAIKNDVAENYACFIYLCNFLNEEDRCETEWKNKIAKAKNFLVNLSNENFPATEEVSIDSIPREANVFIDGKLAGKTPFVAYLPKGMHVFRFILENYRENTVKKDISEKTLIKPELQPLSGLLEIKVQPEGAKIYLDDSFCANGRFIKNILPGVHNVSIELEGYQGISEKIEIMDGEKVSREYILEKLKQQETTNTLDVWVTTTPQSALITIDGKIIGYSPKLVKNITKGEHQIKVETPGYVPYNKQIEIREERINIMLEEMKIN